jgi:NAD(P)-dependent dehydrogenase (short-subunit alcohol dehydrogenase family)
MEDPSTVECLSLRRRTLIVGASRGIGRATAQELARRGGDVALGFVTNRQAAEAAADALEADCSPVLIQADIAEDPAGIVAKAVAGLGGLDAVVVTAVPLITGPIATVTAAEARRAFDVMVHGFREVALAARPHLAERRGSIVAVSSLGAARTAAFYGALGPAKAALEATVRYLAVELGRDGIRVNAVSPGLVDDEEHLNDVPEVMALRSATANRTPLSRRLPTPADIARTIAALLSDDLAFVTGQILRVDGAYSLPL